MVSCKGLLKAAALLLSTQQAAALALRGKPTDFIRRYEGEVLQDIVTWDDHSLFVHGERIMFYSAEFHPYRLPNPSLWLDVFEKIRALGYNAVSFYVHWALLEGKPGEFSAEGVFAWEPFFEAAQKAGIYLLARPGPYINAEASGGGFPGWLQRIKGILRTPAPSYLHATDNYVQSIGQIVAKAQITNGGPVILVQPENEYTGATDNVVFPSPKYMNYVMKQYRDAGIVVPFLSNDASASGHNAPGKPAAVDIYGHDGYPLGFDCANPAVWPDAGLPTNWRTLHEEQSPTTPYSIVEFQAGAFDPWGGLGFEQCAALVNNEFERVFYKNNLGFGVTLFNLYMTYGGTNWGNLGHPGGYTSYDYGAPIRETREVDREKYSEAKLVAHFAQSSPAYLTAAPQNASFDYTNKGQSLTVTPLLGNTTNFYVIRHTDYRSRGSVNYKAKLPTSKGKLTVPQLQGYLTLHGRDSKIHVSDYQVGDFNMLYSSAEVFTWKAYSGKTVLVLYGGQDEAHELAFTDLPDGKVQAPTGVATETQEGVTIINWATAPDAQVVKLPGNLEVYLLDRNTAYNFWTLELPSTSETPTPNALIVKAGYLMRSASVSGNTIALVGDVNATTPIEIVGGAPSTVSKVTFNGKAVPHRKNKYGAITATVTYSEPKMSVPDLSSLSWSYTDTLPELEADYDDSDWTDADHTSTNNPWGLKTPTSLYSSDYGYHTGTLLYRGHFTSQGSESTLKIDTQGGSAYGMSAWLGSTYLGSFTGFDAASNSTRTLTLPNLTKGKDYVITVAIDSMGLNEDWVVGTDEMKYPRGIMDYSLSGRAQKAITWKLTGNLGGEDYVDKTRGPLNEGGLWAERNGYHLPDAPVDAWKSAAGAPMMEGVAGAGINWYVTSFDLNMPSGYDTPLYFEFANTTTPVSDYRVQLYVNGWQFGKYVNNIGPQTAYPVPEGILDYHGSNTVTVSLWSLQADGAKIEDLSLKAGHPVLTGYGDVSLVDSPTYAKRQGAY